MLLNPPLQPPQLLEDPVACTPQRPILLTGGMVAPFDPGVRAARVGGLIFGKWDSRSRIYARGPRGRSRHKPDGWGANGQDPCVPSLSPREEKPTPVRDV